MNRSFTCQTCGQSTMRARLSAQGDIVCPHCAVRPQAASADMTYGGNWSGMTDHSDALHEEGMYQREPDE